MTYTDTENIIGQLENSGMLVTYNDREHYYNIYKSGPFFNFHMTLYDDDDRELPEIVNFINSSYDTFVKETNRLVNLYEKYEDKVELVAEYD